MELHSEIAIIEEVLSQLRPVINGDGGDITFVKYEHNIVYVKLAGACIGCPASMYTLKLGVEEALRVKLPNLFEVIALDE